MDKKEENINYYSSIQKSIKKLISEEWFAGQMYRLFKEAVDMSERKLIDGLMETTAEDELNDHMRNLIDIAQKFGYDVPATLKEFQKYASEADSKAFESFKNRKDAETYVKLAIESEERAITSYAEALNNEDLFECQEIRNVMTNNYYDEVEHLQQFKFLLIQMELAQIC